MTIPVIGALKPWQMTFIALGLPGMLFVLIFFTISEPIRRASASATTAAHAKLADVFHHMLGRWRLYGCHFMAFSFHSMLGWASFAWIPEYFIRHFGVDRAAIAFDFGLIVLLFGSAGLLAGGWIADRMDARGITDAKLRIALYGNYGLIVPAVLFPLMPTDNLALSVLCVSTFFIAFPYGNAVAALQIVTPNRMRGLVSAIYLFVINILGLGLGPTMVAFFTDFVFADPARLNLSLVAAGAITVPTSIVFLLLCLRPYRELSAISHY